MSAYILNDTFVPRPSLRGGHWMTLYGWGNPRYFPQLPPPTVRYFDVADQTRVLAHCHWQPRPWEHPALILLHGLNVVRLNQRNCGNTERLSAGLFHSGLTHDAKFVIDELAAVDSVGAI